MLERVIGWSIENRVLIIIAALLTALVGMYSLIRTPLDAIPDLSDVQVIVYTEYPGQAPRIVEDQVTYPLTTQLLAAPFAKVVRGYSFFGFSFVYVIFEDGTDLYWARGRVLETLSHVARQLPAGVTPTLGPDATGVGWAFMYALKSDRHDLAELRSIQDWYLKYELTSVPGVSEVASIGGFVRQYQVTVDPNRLRAYGIPLSRIRDAINLSNSDVGGRLLEIAEKEFMIRGQGLIESLDDIRAIALGVNAAGTPILLEDVAEVGVGPEMRRGIAEWNGEGETVGGIVVVRHGEGTLEVIQAVKAKLEAAKAGLPDGVEIEVAYDRTALIERAVTSLGVSLGQQLVIVGLVCIAFLFHVRSGMVAIITLPLGILIAFIVMSAQGVNVNIMSLGGIAVAIGTMVDAGIVMVENAHRHLSEARGRRPHWEVIAEATKEVGPTLFFALLVITVSFLPVVRARSAGGPAVQAARFRQDLRDGGGGAARGDAHPRARRLLGQGISPRKRRASRPLVPAVRLGVVRARPVRAAGAQRRTTIPVRRRRSRRGRARRDHRPVHAARHGVHAVAVGGRPAVHADHAARHLDHQGRRSPAADRPHHPHVPRGRERLRQGRTRRDRHGSGAAVHDRNHDHPETGGRVARGHDAGGVDRGTRRRHPRPRPHQRLDHAHPDPHRHALDRHQDARRGQGRRSGLRRTRTPRAEDRRHRQRVCRARVARTRSGSWAATTSTSRWTAPPSPATA